LNKSKTGQLIPGVPVTNAQQREQQKRVFEKVWKSVEGIIDDLKDKLHAMLQDPSRTVEEQERTIEWVVQTIMDQASLISAQNPHRAGRGR
jgi:exocyst complex component 2